MPKGRAGNNIRAFFKSNAEKAHRTAFEEDKIHSPSTITSADISLK
jgi:hypothetical protein